MKKLIAVLILLVVAIVVITVRSTDQKNIADKSSPVVDTSTQSNREQSHLHEYAVKGRVPAYYTTPPDTKSLGPTLSPNLFTGYTKLAYKAAQEIPQTLAQLPCYCHCDREQNHKSLHSCFESEHGENCGICINEALMAYNLQKQGLGVAEIRKRIIAAYAQE